MYPKAFVQFERSNLLINCHIQITTDKSQQIQLTKYKLSQKYNLQHNLKIVTNRYFNIFIKRPFSIIKYLYIYISFYCNCMDI
jgi:hypothetical protein